MKLFDSKNPCSFCAAVYQLISLIPSGRVTSYGDIAKGIGYPGYARSVARCLRLTPAGMKLPWFRVVRSNLEIALPPDSKGRCLQEKLLSEEGAMKKGRPVKERKWIYD